MVIVHKVRKTCFISVLSFNKFLIFQLLPNRKKPWLRFSSANRACLFYQTPPLLPYLDDHYSTRSTTNAICLPR